MNHINNCKTLLLFTIWSLWLVSHSFLLGPYSYTKLHDNAESYLPAKLSINSITEIYPFKKWNHQWEAGSDLLASTYTSDFDILLFIFLPGWMAYGLFLFLQRLIAGYFCFRLLNDFANVDRISAICSGLVYSFFSYHSINAQWDGFVLQNGLWLPGIPFILWYSEIVRQKKSFYSLVGAAIAIGIFIAFSSIYVYSMFAFIAIISWLLIINPCHIKKSLILIVICAVSWLICETPCIVSGLLNAPFSQRTNRGAEHFLLNQSWSKIKLFLQENIFQLIVIFSAIFITKEFNKKLRRILALSIGCILFYLFYHFIYKYIQYHMGFLKVIKLNNIYLIVPFFLTSAMGICLTMLQDYKIISDTKKHTINTQIFIAVLFITVVFFQSLANKELALKNIIKGHFYANLFEHPVIHEFIDTVKYQKKKDRVATISGQGCHIPPSTLWSYGLYTADGNVLLHPMRYKELWAEIIHPSQKSRFMSKGGGELGLFIQSSTSSQSQDSIFLNSKILSFLNVKYIFSSIPLELPFTRQIPLHLNDQISQLWKERFKFKILKYITAQNAPYCPIYIYENMNVFKKFYLAGKIKKFSEKKNLLISLKNSSIKELQSTAYVYSDEIKGDMHELVKNPNNSIKKIHTDSSQNTALTVTLNTCSILVISRSYSKYWKAYVDGEQKNIFSVNHAIQGVYLDEGTHQVNFYYNPPY